MTTSNFNQMLTRSFPALRHRNFRIFWIGQCVSLIGTWMQNIGQSWLVLKLTGSPLMLSLITTMQFLPMMTLSLFFGTLVDKFPKRKVLIITQTIMMILAFILALITYLDIVQYWHIVLLALSLGIVNTLDMPTRQSYFSEMVPREDLMNAVALNSSIFNLARIIGPAMAGVMIALVGIPVCFFLNSLSFLAVITSLTLINTPILPIKKSTGPIIKTVLNDVKEGLRYISTRDTLRRPLMLLAFISVFVMNYNVLIPIFAEQTLGMNAAGYGYLMTSMGVGSFVGAMTLAMRSKSGPKFKYILAGGLGASFFLGILGTQRNLLIVPVILFLIGFSSITFTAVVNSTIQINSEVHMRGRVMSMYALLFGGLTPIGSLYAGFIMEYFGAPGCMIISGIIGTLASIFLINQRRNNNSNLKTVPLSSQTE